MQKIVILRTSCARTDITHSLCLSEDLLTLGKGVCLRSSGTQRRWCTIHRRGGREGRGTAADGKDERGCGGELHGVGVSMSRMRRYRKWEWRRLNWRGNNNMTKIQISDDLTSASNYRERSSPWQQLYSASHFGDQIKALRSVHTDAAMRRDATWSSQLCSTRYRSFAFLHSSKECLTMFK